MHARFPSRLACSRNPRREPNGAFHTASNKIYTSLDCELSIMHVRSMVLVGYLMHGKVGQRSMERST